ncbi:MAG TPA: hypothetical protein VFO52_06710 [Longimicrobiales bacterium]|nr:hypothetical protein [Longimicrobiales bacterium]
MRVLRKFLWTHALWSAGIMLLVIPISLLTADGLEVVQYLRWLAHSIALATFPAGLMVGADAFRGPAVWRNIGLLSLAEIAIMIIVLVLLGFAAPMGGLDLFELIAQLPTSPTPDWLRWNQMAWSVYMTAAEAISVPVYSGLGIMLGAWAEQVLPQTLRRILFWAMSLLLVVFTYMMTENSYEMLVIKTNGPAAFSAFFVLLIPVGMYAGLLLPSVALAQRVRTQ